MSGDAGWWCGHTSDHPLSAFFSRDQMSSSWGTAEIYVHNHVVVITWKKVRRQTLRPVLKSDDGRESGLTVTLILPTTHSSRVYYFSPIGMSPFVLGWLTNASMEASFKGHSFSSKQRQPHCTKHRNVKYLF